MKNLNDASQIFLLTGLQQVIIDIFHFGQRQELITRVDEVFSTFILQDPILDYVKKNTMFWKLKVQIA